MSVNLSITEAVRIEALVWMIRIEPEAFLFDEYYHKLGILEEYKRVNNRHLLKSDVLFPKLQRIDKFFLSKVNEIKKQTDFLVKSARERVLEGELYISDIEFNYRFSLFSTLKYKDDDYLSSEPFFIFSRHKTFPIKYDFEGYENYDKYFDEDSNKDDAGLLIGDKFLGNNKVSSLLLYLHEDTFLSYYDIAEIENIKIELKMIYNI